MTNAAFYLVPADPEQLIGVSDSVGMHPGNDDKLYLVKPDSTAIDVGATRVNEVASIASSIAETKSQEAINALTYIGRKLTPPSWFTWELPFGVYELPSGLIYTDLVPRSRMVTPSVTYYLSPSGNDSNNGTSRSTPKKSIGALIDTLNSSPPTGATIWLEPGDYLGTNGIDGKSINFPCNLICSGGTAYVGKTYTAIEWIEDETRENLWRAVSPTSTLIRGVVDRTATPNADGILPNLKFFSNALTVNDTPGAYYANASTLLIRLHDDREPDANVLIFDPVNPVWNQTTNQQIYVEGVHFMGGSKSVLLDAAATGQMRVVLNRCACRYSASANGLECKNASGVTSADAEVILFDCDATYNKLDGFGYRNQFRVAEFNCSGKWNGWDSTAGSDNGTTGHNECQIVRLNGVYTDNMDRNFHDINHVQSWNLNCIAGRSRNGSDTPSLSSCFAIGQASAAEGSTKVRLYKCRSVGGSAIDITVRGSSIAEIEGGSGFQTTSLGESGAVIRQ